MGQLSGQDVAEDFKVPVRVRGESTVGLDSVFVQDP